MRNDLLFADVERSEPEFGLKSRGGYGFQVRCPTVEHRRLHGVIAYALFVEVKSDAGGGPGYHE